MAKTMKDILHPGSTEESDPDFPNAPEGWSRRAAEEVAAREGLKLGDTHWEVIRVLQGCYTDEPAPRIRLLNDALEARFAASGGRRYLFEILPGGPIAQGCRLAGLKAPPESSDPAFGSMQ